MTYHMALVTDEVEFHVGRQGGLEVIEYLFHLVAEVALLLVARQHYEVVDAVLGLLNGRVVGMARYHLRVRQGKIRVGRQAQRQIDGLLRGIGQ